MIVADIDDAEPKKITLAGVSPMQKDLAQQIAGVLWDKKALVWRMPLGWASCLALRGVFKTQLEVGPALALWAANEKLTRIDPSLALREALDADGLEMLYPHQRAGAQFIKVAKRLILADDMGTGKTFTSIAGLMELYKAGDEVFPALIVCPNSTKMGWKREIEKIWPGLITIVVSGSVTQRRKQLKTPAHFYIMNWEAVRSHSRLSPFGSVALKKCVECGGQDEKLTATSCHTHIKELNEIDFKAVIGDEVHRIKDAKSLQTRAFKFATGDADIRIGLSGTPIASHQGDLWSILNWISPQEWPSKSKYLDRVLEVAYDVWGSTHVIGIKPHMRAEFFAGLDPRLRRMPMEVVLPNLPDFVYERRDVEMSPKQKKAYVQMRDQMIAELDDQELAIATSPLTRTIRMLQFASSYAELEEYWDEKEQKTKTKVLLAAPSSKIDAFLADFDDFEGKPVVVFAASRQLIELLSLKLDKLDIKHGLITGAISIEDRQMYMDRFQAGKLNLMLCTTGAGGTGITLNAADTAVFLQRPWSMIESKQSQARVRRIGSEGFETINIIDYVSAGTLDEVVIKAIEEKSDRLEEILRDKDLLRKVLGGDE